MLFNPKVVKFADGVFGIRRYSFLSLQYEFLSNTDDVFWWLPKLKYKKYFQFKTLEEATNRLWEYSGKDREMVVVSTYNVLKQ